MTTGKAVRLVFKLSMAHYHQKPVLPSLKNFRACAIVATLASSLLSVNAAHASPRVVVLDVELTGDLGGPAFSSQHQARLEMASARLRENLQRSDLYQVLDNARAQESIDRLSGQHLYLHNCGECALEIGRELGADRVLVSWVFRVSALILTLNYEMIDVSTGQITARKSFDFRGDNDVAWTRAIDYMVRDMKSEGAK
ncbi:MAG TPA: DUF3280 domain-containing protein [Steroidobacteraceae bacterium]|nr:DUF3280 domain-containing protein [Steroidobacteraceae bacterium]